MVYMSYIFYNDSECFFFENISEYFRMFQNILKDIKSI